MRKKEVIEEGHIIVHPTRFAIVEYLMKNDGAYISQMENGIQIDRRLLSFHLGRLEKHGFVKGKYEISNHPKSKGRAIKRYFLTKKAEDVYSGLREILSSPKKV